MASPESSAAGGVAVIGSGLIGRSWAMLFAAGGIPVRLYDVDPRQVTGALDNIRKEMTLLAQSGSLKGALSAEEQLSLIGGCSDIREAVEGAMHIQECVPEDLELKQQLFAQLDGIMDDDVVLSSSSSCLLPSKLFAGLAHRKQCLVAHPVNPPYHVPLVELVPHPETAPATVDRTHALMRKIGQSPVRIMKEIDGFALNRLQYAVISEAWRLVEEGVVSPGDLDLVMSEGLGMRYAFIGPLETMHLNAEGMLSYCDRYSEGMKRVLKTFGPIPEFSGATAEKVHQAMCVKVPDDPAHLAARREWRDRCLMRLAKLKSQVQPQ
ncbi:lambda-crystallin homolog isoform X4 [Vicugna pacos]|uniref:L-gulonate 3-dehydrogenase n=1 Tax=Vicugna pacos TaxID=30538 RepID=A0A6J3B354_VICPA|nr:lambda-crystallin homolog isoform X2 [Vicugna pacos]